MARIILFLLFISFSAQGKFYEVNNQHSFVNFDLDYMQVSEVKGTFDRFEGAFEKDDNKISDIRFLINVASINTRDKKRDAHLKREDFFAVKKFPEISFEGKDVTYSKEGKPVAVKGLLTLKGVTKEHSFDLDWKGEFSDPVHPEKKSLFFKARTVVNRKDFGISWNKEMDQGGWVVGEEVRVEVVIEANPTDARPAFSRFFLKKNKLLPGKLTLESSLKENVNEPTPESTKPVEKKKELNREGLSALNGAVKLFLGFLIFLLMLLGSIFLKRKLNQLLKKVFRPLISDLISDAILYTFLVLVAVKLAPLMGYHDF